MKRNIAFAAFLVFAALLSTGCVTPPQGLATIKGTEQDDIPVPRDFEFKESESFDQKGLSENARFRSWRGYYKGTGYVGDIASWYVGQMRNRGWQFKKRADQLERRKLCFEKEDEVSEIDIYRELDSSAGGFVTIVRAEIHPRGPEDLTVEEHFTGKEAEVKPASFSTKDLPPEGPPPTLKKRGTSGEAQPLPTGRKSGEERTAGKGQPLDADASETFPSSVAPPVDAASFREIDEIEKSAQGSSSQSPPPQKSGKKKK